MPFLYLNLQEDQKINLYGSTNKVKQQKIFYSDTIHGKDILLFVHGWLLDSSIFSFYTTELQEHYRVISLDLPAHGKSSKEKNKDYNLLIAFRAVKQLVVALQEESNSVTVVGFSMGAFLALKLSLFYPKLIDRLILISPLITLDAFERNIIRLEKLNPPLLFFSLFIRSLLLVFPFNELTQEEYPTQRIGFFKRIKIFFLLKKKFSLHTIYHYMSGFHNVSIESLIKNNNKPTLLIHGKQDVFVSEQSIANYSRNMSHSRLVTMNDAAHNTLFTNKEEILYVMNDFLKSINKRKYGWLKLFSEKKPK